MNIIFADDEKDLSFLVKNALEKKGHRVTLDPNATLLQHMGRERSDLIFLDITLKNQDGGDLCTELKNNPHTKNIPIILISGLMDLKQIAQLCGAQGYLNKPFEISELESLIEIYSNNIVIK